VEPINGQGVSLFLLGNRDGCDTYRRHPACLKVIIVKGEVREIREMADLLKAAKGVKSGELTAASTGRKL
jgi:hypothetical protein